MIHTRQFRELIIKPALTHIGLYSQAAENLLLGTALVESRLEYLKQLRGGPALSLYQIEPVTHNDIWDNYLEYRTDLKIKVVELLSHMDCRKEDELIGNLPYATAMARLVYYRIPEPLPKANDIMALANYWKKYYNTELGKGDPLKFFELYNTYAR